MNDCKIGEYGLFYGADDDNSVWDWIQEEDRIMYDCCDFYNDDDKFTAMFTVEQINEMNKNLKSKKQHINKK